MTLDELQKSIAPDYPSTMRTILPALAIKGIANELSDTVREKMPKGEISDHKEKRRVASLMARLIRNCSFLASDLGMSLDDIMESEEF